MYEFSYHRPTTIDKAGKLLGSAAEAKLLAGGHTLLPTMKQRLASPANIIDLTAVKGMRGIKMSGAILSIGAMTTHAEVASSKSVKKAIPSLAALAGVIGDPQVRHRGTIGGSVANNDPSADYPAACLALGATIVTNKRSLKAEEFFTGLFETALGEDEIIVRLEFPVGIKGAYSKFRNPASRYAMVGVYVALHGKDVRVAVTGAGANGVFRASVLEVALKADFSAKALAGKHVDAKTLNSDSHADAAYRAHLITVMAQRAVAAAA